MIRKCQIQIGDALLDADLEMVQEELPEEIKRGAERLQQAFNWPLWNVGITEDKIVEGSLVEPITDENRLLDHAEQ